MIRSSKKYNILMVEYEKRITLIPDKELFFEDGPKPKTDQNNYVSDTKETEEWGSISNFDNFD